jgi:hypothetical protein
MLVVLSDTHSDAGHELAGRAREAVAVADAVVHAGDFTTPEALDAFRGVADPLYAVHGNADAPAVRERLPPARTVAALGLRIAVTHRRAGADTGLVMFGRDRDADLVVSGHTHQPRFRAPDSRAESGEETEAGVGTGPALLNPGSHAEPRGGPATHAELVRVDGESDGGGDGNGGGTGDCAPERAQVRGELRRRDGTVQRTFTLTAPTG